MAYTSVRNKSVGASHPLIRAQRGNLTILRQVAAAHSTYPIGSENGTFAVKARKRQEH